MGEELGKVCHLVGEAVEHLLLLIAGLREAGNVPVDGSHLGADGAEVRSDVVDPGMYLRTKGKTVGGVLGDEGRQSTVPLAEVVAGRGQWLQLGRWLLLWL